MSKKLLAIIMTLSMTASLLAGCGNSNETEDSSAGTVPDTDTAAETTDGSDFSYMIGISNLDDSDENCYIACETMKALIESDEFAEKVGHQVTAEWVDSASDVNKQTTNVETLIAKGIDALFLIGVDTSGNSTAVKACNKAGVPVFMTATESEEGDNNCYLYGTPGREAFIQREEGFLDAIKDAGRDDLLDNGQPMSTQACQNSSAEEAMQVTEDWIQAYGNDINWIVSQNNTMVQGAIEVLKAANMIDQVKLNGWIVSGTWDLDFLTDGYEEYAIYVSFAELGNTMANVCEKFYTEGYDACEDQTYMEIFDVTGDNVNEYFDLP